MAKRRFLSKDVTHTAKFLSMPLETQGLYSFLVLESDDDGYVECLSVIRMHGANEQNLDILTRNGFIKLFPDLVAYVIDWDKMNKVEPSKKIDSIYRGIYPIISLEKVETNSSKSSEQVRLGKVSIDISPDFKKNRGVDSLKAKKAGCPNPKGHKDCVDCINSIQSSYKKKFANYPKQISAYHKLLTTGFSEKQIQHALDTIDDDRFYSVKGWDLMDVLNVLSKGGSKYV